MSLTSVDIANSSLLVQAVKLQKLIIARLILKFVDFLGSFFEFLHTQSPVSMAMAWCPFRDDVTRNKHLQQKAYWIKEKSSKEKEEKHERAHFELFIYAFGV